GTDHGGVRDLGDGDVGAVGDVHRDRGDEVLHLGGEGSRRTALDVGAAEVDALARREDAGGSQVDGRLAEGVLRLRRAGDGIGDGRLSEGGVVDGADGDAARGEVDARVPGGAEPAVQREVDDVAAGGEVEADEHVAGGPHRGDAVAADRRGLVELEVDV